jgi:hypothetical protein
MGGPQHRSRERNASVIFRVAQSRMVLMHGFVTDDAHDPGRGSNPGPHAPRRRLGRFLLRLFEAYEVTEAVAIKRLLAWDVENAMEKHLPTKSETGRGEWTANSTGSMTPARRLRDSGNAHPRCPGDGPGSSLSSSRLRSAGCADAHGRDVAAERFHRTRSRAITPP